MYKNALLVLTVAMLFCVSCKTQKSSNQFHYQGESTLIRVVSFEGNRDIVTGEVEFIPNGCIHYATKDKFDKTIRRIVCGNYQIFGFENNKSMKKDLRNK